MSAILSYLITEADEKVAPDAKVAYVARPGTKRRISSTVKGLMVESRPVCGVTSSHAGYDREKLAHTSTRVFRVTDDFILQCQSLVDDVFREDSLCRYLRPADDKPVFRGRYYEQSRRLALRRAIVKGDIPVRAAVTMRIVQAEAELEQEVQSCAGFALWRVMNASGVYAWDLFVFDVMTMHLRLIGALFSLARDCSVEFEVPGGVVDPERYAQYVKARTKVVTKLLDGRRYLTVRNVGVVESLRHEGVGTKLLQYGLDMADTQNLPIYLEASSLPFLKLCEKAGFRLVHELRLAAKDEHAKCSVYCMLREPGIKKLSPPLMLPGSVECS